MLEKGVKEINKNLPVAGGVLGGAFLLTQAKQAANIQVLNEFPEIIDAGLVVGGVMTREVKGFPREISNGFILAGVVALVVDVAGRLDFDLSF